MSEKSVLTRVSQKSVFKQHCFTSMSEECLDMMHIVQLESVKLGV